MPPRRRDRRRSAAARAVSSLRPRGAARAASAAHTRSTSSGQTVTAARTSLRKEGSLSRTREAAEVTQRRAPAPPPPGALLAARAPWTRPAAGQLRPSRAVGDKRAKAARTSLRKRAVCPGRMRPRRRRSVMPRPPPDAPPAKLSRRGRPLRWGTLAARLPHRDKLPNISGLFQEKRAVCPRRERRHGRDAAACPPDRDALPTCSSVDALNRGGARPPDRDKLSNISGLFQEKRAVCPRRHGRDAAACLPRPQRSAYLQLCQRP